MVLLPGLEVSGDCMLGELQSLADYGSLCAQRLDLGYRGWDCETARLGLQGLLHKGTYDPPC